MRDSSINLRYRRIPWPMKVVLALLAVVFVSHWLPFIPGPAGGAGVINDAADWIILLSFRAHFWWAFVVWGLVGLALLGALASAFLPTGKNRGWQGGIALATFLCGFFPVAMGSTLLVKALVEPWSIRYSAQRAEPLITALRRFKQHQGTFPRHLEELIPHYLAELPTPGTLGATPFRLYSEHTLSSVFFEYPALYNGFSLRYCVRYIPDAGNHNSRNRRAVGVPNWYIELQDYVPGP